MTQSNDLRQRFNGIAPVSKPNWMWHQGQYYKISHPVSDLPKGLAEECVIRVTKKLNQWMLTPKTKPHPIR